MPPDLIVTHSGGGPATGHPTAVTRSPCGAAEASACPQVVAYHRELRAAGVRISLSSCRRLYVLYCNRYSDDEGFLAGFLAVAAGLTARGTQVSVDSSIWAALVAAADSLNADVIVTGSRGETGLKALLHSSISEHIMRHCRRPVMIVPSGCAELVDEPVSTT